MKAVCTFKFAKATPGALQYKQVEENGKPVEEGNDGIRNVHHIQLEA